MSTTDVDVSVKWLRRWAPSGPWVITAIDPTEGYIRTRGFCQDDVMKLRQFLAEWRPRRGLYFQVNPDLRPVAEITKKGRKEHIASAVALHVDLDTYKEGEDREAGQSRALEMLTSDLPSGIPGPPSIINNSGNGAHAFWLLDEPVVVDGDLLRAEKVERYNRGLAAALGGDSTTDVSRILRLPGSINWPNAKKRALGLAPVAVRPLKFDAGLRYRIDQFPAADGPVSRPTTLNAERAASRLQIGPAVSVEDLDDLKVPDRVKMLIALGALPDTPRVGRSEHLFSAICAMLRCGESDEVVLGVITDGRFHISDSVLDKPDPEAHARHQIRRAHAWLSSQDEFDDAP
ncbi:MAG TPA: hypothetical protein VGV07_17995 [Devosia sp.]|jgi:hypothetical protein|uniref:hypothetical protein n=1 Tax=Devosia sp. TaxID=1871048 RepID=UPI002DDD48B4|nr:hypothetical protein [Devosia sp.]HEV2517151.1 hypothetical protein [Devosia sp.]